MKMSSMLGIGLAAALTLGAVSPSSAVPISNGATLKQAVPAAVTDVRWRGGGFAGGLALGVLGGAAIAGAYPYYGYPRYAYYPGPYYGGPYYGGPYWGPRPYWGWRHRYYYRHWHRW
jgi:hypothetical protein